MPYKYRQLDNHYSDEGNRAQNAAAKARAPKKASGGSGPLYKQKKPKSGSKLVMTKMSDPPIDVYSDGTQIRRPATGRMKQIQTERKRRGIQKELQKGY